MKWLKRNYMHIICIFVIIFSLVCTAILFTNSVNRIIESFRDFGLSVAYYFCELFKIEHNITVTVTELPSLSIVPSQGSPSVDIPATWSGFKESFIAYWKLWVSKDNITGYFTFLGNALYLFSYVILIFLPLILILYIVIKQIYNKPNNKYNEDSKPLKIFRLFTKYLYHPVKEWILSFIDFVRAHRYYIIIFCIVWALNFNLLTIFVEFIAYYMYFCVSFDFLSLYLQVYKLALDLYTPIKFIPLWVWLAVGFVIFNCYRKKIAYLRLNHMERCNRGFISERPIVYMFCGTMGKKKTTLLTDIAISQEAMFRNKALEKILENDLKFPYFPWINLENELKRAINFHEVYNLATCRKWAEKKYSRWNKSQCKEKCFGYDYDTYGFTYDDKLKVVDIWEVVETYSQLYFIYIVQSSLIVSNYAIRTDMVMSDTGNFPVWDEDIFRRDSRLQAAYSRHSHILDFDALRLGKKMVEDNAYSDWFEFGIINLTEIGKERKNAVELRGIKKLEETTNQLNDGFNEWLKLVRHSATVDYFPFVAVLTDDQRPESWGADARQLCDLIYIRSCGDMQLSMPFFSFTELCYDFIWNKFINLYMKYRYRRSDNTLFIYIFKSIIGRLQHYYSGVYNRFGYSVLNLQVESGTMDGKYEDRKYYLMNKKIYSRRFSTDCYSDFFVKKALHSAVGIEDIPEYGSEKASVDELKSQHSYFINDITKGDKDV